MIYDELVDYFYTFTFVGIFKLQKYTEYKT